MSASELLNPPPADCAENRKVLFFDIDNTLYRKTSGVGKLMQEYIRNYIEETLHLNFQQAELLHQSYYKTYGLAIEGLVREKHVDAMDYNAKVDDALPLEKHIKPDPRLIEMFSRIDRQKWKLWLCTNAYRNHGIRVVKLLGIEKFFEGITYCDYAQVPMICKPMEEFFLGAMNDVGVKYNEKTKSVEPACYFVDDSAINVQSAEQFGWVAVNIDEPNEAHIPEDIDAVPLLPPLRSGSRKRIQYLLQLPAVFPEAFE